MKHEEDHPLTDRASSEAFVRECYLGLFRWFCRISGSADQAADLTQETFAAFWQARERRPPGVCPRTWLFAIGRNLWRKQSRDRKGFASAMLSLLVETGPSPEKIFQDQEFQDAALRALLELPEVLREAFALRFWQEFSYEQIGAIQEVSADLARWRYFAARRRLHDKLVAWDPAARQVTGDRYER